MQNSNLDLFGEIIITQTDLFLWVQAVSPRNLYNERTYNNYLRSYDIAGKVRTAKQYGTFDRIVYDRLERVKPWHDRLALDMLVQ